MNGKEYKAYSFKSMAIEKEITANLLGGSDC